MAAYGIKGKFPMMSIIGHKELITHLESINKDPTNTFLFCGPVSVGKRTVAFELSKSILCETKKEECHCKSCKRFPSDHPDFLCVGRKDKIKVDDIEKILDFSMTTPFLSKNKIIIIDNAHNITWEAANRLLKILEEPPSFFSFFLISSEPQKILPTILSRCISFEFKSLTREDLTNILWKKLGFSLPEAKVLGWIGVDSSLDIFSDAGKYLKYRYMALELINSIKNKKLIDLLDYVDKIEKEDLSIFSDLFLILLTDVLLIKKGIIKIVNSDVIDNIKKISEKFNIKALIGIINSFSQLKKYSYLNINMNINLKNLFIKNFPLFIAE